MAVKKYHKKEVNGNVIFVGQNFLESEKEKHLKKERNDGKKHTERYVTIFFVYL